MQEMKLLETPALVVSSKGGWLGDKPHLFWWSLASFAIFLMMVYRQPAMMQLLQMLGPGITPGITSCSLHLCLTECVSLVRTIESFHTQERFLRVCLFSRSFSLRVSELIPSLVFSFRLFSLATVIQLATVIPLRCNTHSRTHGNTGACMSDVCILRGWNLIAFLCDLCDPL